MSHAPPDLSPDPASDAPPVARRFARFVLRFRWLWVVLAVAMLAGAGTGFGNLRFNPDARLFFAEDNPDRVALDQFEAAFSRDDNVVFVLAPKNGDVFTQPTIQAVGEITERSWLLPNVRRVNSLTNFSHSYDNDGIMEVNDLIMDPANTSPEELAAARDYALSQIETVNVVVSEDGSVTSITALMRIGGDEGANDAAVEALYRAVMDIRADVMAQYGDALDIYVSGIGVYNKAFAAAGENDIKNYAMPMFLSIILIVGLSVRSAIGAGLTLLVAFMSTAFAFGLVGYWEPALNPPKINTLFVIPILLVAATTHLSAAVRQQMTRSPDKRQWVENALADHAGPIAIAAVTTMFGFLSLNFSISPPFRAFGNMVASGLVYGLFLTLFFLPAMLLLLPMKRRVEQAAASKISYWLGDFVVRRRTPLLIVMIGVLLATATGLPRLRLDDDFSRYFSKDFEIESGSGFQLRSDTDFIQERMNGFQILEYPISCAAPGQAAGANSECIYDSAFLAQVDAFAEWARAQPKVAYVRSYSDTVKRIQSNFMGDDPEYYVIPQEGTVIRFDDGESYTFSAGDAKEAVAQLTLMYENSLQQGMDLTDQIDVDREALRVTINLQDASTADANGFEARAAAWFDANAPEIKTTATGMSHVFNLISQRDARSMLIGTLLALVAISGAMLFALRSVKLGAISLIPNLIPAVMALGIWGYAHGNVTLAIAVVIALTLGIVVDDSVHFLSKYAKGRRDGKSPEDSVRYAFQSVGMALLVTTIGLTIGFIILSMSDFAVNSQLGELTAVTVALALLADFFLLPPLLMILDRDRKEISMTRLKPAAAATAAVLIGVLALGAAAPAFAETAEQKGLRIAQAADAADQGWGDMQVSGEMILRDPRGRENRRAFSSRALENTAPGQGDQSMIVFSSPRDIRGTASLTHSKIEPQDDDQWLYLPAFRRIKRISSSNRTGKFVGSEFSYEDLGSNEVNDYTYRWLRDEPCPSQPSLTCHVVESFPVNPRSGYSRRVGWMDMQEYRLFQVQFFNRANVLEKVMTQTGFREYMGRHWRPSSVVMRNLQSRKETELVWGAYQFRTGLSASTFDPSRLRNAAR